METMKIGSREFDVLGYINLKSSITAPILNIRMMDNQRELELAAQRFIGLFQNKSPKISSKQIIRSSYRWHLNAVTTVALSSSVICSSTQSGR